jgi:hypothetical protein
MSDDCGTQSFVAFKCAGPRFRCGVIVFVALLTAAALVSLVFTQRVVIGIQDNALAALLTLQQFSFFAGAVGFVPLALCIVYMCSLEARLSAVARAQEVA